MYFAVTTPSSSSKLTRGFDLRRVRQAWLEFRLWFDLADNMEYAYVEVSPDGGKTWSIPAGDHTRARDRFTRFFGDGYTGRSDGWLDERIDLGGYTGQRILLRFEVLADNVTAYRGLAIDDLRIDAIGFHDSFEAPDDAWIAEGWIRTDNRLPNNTWLQVVQETDAGLDVSRSLMTGPGEMIVDLLPGVERAIVAISPIVPQTALETEYSLEVNLLDADGEVIIIDRDCKLTTTTGLNFRDAPNGDKIGLLPQGTAVWALDSREGWFNVEYDSLNGWIHGGYVTQEGNCA